MPYGVIKERKILMNTFAMPMISVLNFIGAVGPINFSELPAATRVTGSTVESIDSTGLSTTDQIAGAETSCLCWSLALRS